MLGAAVGDALGAPVNGMSLAETAETMGKNENAIKQLQLRALRALERQIERRTSHG